jgi:GT2 family glycosyltransferase
MPTVSVVIVNYNGRDFLGETLASLQRQSLPPLEVVVADNASTDGSREWLREAFPQVRVVALESNLGFAEGCNRAAAVASGELLGLLNSDAVADPGWLAESVRALDEHPRAAAAVPKILSGSRPGHIEQAGALFNNLGHYWGRGFGEPDDGRYDEPAEVPGLTACAAVVRRAALGGAPPFDGELFLYAEEFDLTLRLRAAGHAIRYAPRAVVRHLGMRSISAASPQPRVLQQFYCNRNRMKILAKYYPASVLLRGAPLVLMSLAYWNAFFLRAAGPRFLARAVMAQARFAAHGLRERWRGRGVDAAAWLPWMERMGLRRVLAVRDRLRAGDGGPAT